jgi:hypothetical protein
MRIKGKETGLLPPQRPQEPEQKDMLHAVGEIAGMEGVAIVHGDR